MRILVCGGRDFDDYFLMSGMLGCFDGQVELAHGGASGADSMAGRYAESRGWPVTVFKADWNEHGKAAGPIRNSKMLREFNPDIVVAFPGGRGTADMVSKSRKAGVQVMELGK